MFSIFRKPGSGVKFSFIHKEDFNTQIEGITPTHIQMKALLNTIGGAENNPAAGRHYYDAVLKEAGWFMGVQKCFSDDIPWAIDVQNRIRRALHKTTSKDKIIDLLSTIEK